MTPTFNSILEKAPTREIPAGLKVGILAKATFIRSCALAQ